MKPYHYDRTKTYRVNICFQALLTGRKRLGWIPASFPRSAEGESRRGRLNERGLGFNTYIHAMLENLSIILSSVILKTTALVMVTGLSGVQFGL